MSLPLETKRVFSSSENKNQEATISSEFFNSRYYEYEIAYKKAADILINEAISDNSLFLCVSIYPIMFLYRQFIELYVKDILSRFDPEFNGRKSPYNTHNIYKLWGRLLEIVKFYLNYFPKEIENNQFIDILVATDDYMLEIGVFDRNSMAFRYPDDKTHTKTFFPNEISIDLVNLKCRIDELANILCLIEETFVNIKTMEEELNSMLF